MAEGKTKIIVIDEQGKEVPVYIDSLQAGKHKVIIKEEEKPRVEIGEYMAQGTSTTPPPPPECPEGQHLDSNGNCVPDSNPTCGGHSHWDGTKCVCDPGYKDDGSGNCIQAETPPPECPPGQHKDTNGNCVPDQPNPAGVIYDSNTDGQWNNGKSRIVKGHDGDISPNGKGIFTAASGSPEVHIDGKGTAILVTKPGFGRFYLCVNNFNAQLDFDFNIMDSSVDNMSIKGRSRHQAGGIPTNRFGGLGNATSTKDTDFKIELFHNVHEKGYNKTLPTPLKVGEWYSKRYIYHNTDDNKGIKMEDWIDFKDGKGLVKIFERTETHPQQYYMDPTQFNKESWIWFRLNGSGSIAFKNVKVTAL
jgi:hypothetical protein